jgi:hypothetical protein
MDVASIASDAIRVLIRSPSHLFDGRPTAEDGHPIFGQLSLTKTIPPDYYNAMLPQLMRVYTEIKQE